MNKKSTPVLRLDNRLVYHGSYSLSAKALKIIYYVISKYVDPLEEQKALPILDIPLQEIATAITETDSKKKKNWSGSLYESIDDVCNEMSEARIKFDSGVEVEGKNLHGHINLCSVVPRMIDGKRYISFGFDPFMAQFLFDLTKYVLVYRPEINRLRSAYSIRLFQMLKGYARKKAKYGNKIFRDTYSISHLRFLFSLGNTYPEFKHFNNLVIKRAVREINANTTIRVIEVNKRKQNGSRTTSHLEFVFTEQQPNEKLKINLQAETDLTSYVPDADDLAQLSKAERQAYQKLVDLGVIPGIAYRKILPEIQGSESEGFEDYFIEYCLQHFQERSKHSDDPKKAAATFVNWWTKKKIFDLTSDVWSKVNEQVVNKKKELATQNPVSYNNRLMAKNMTKDEFAAWWEEQKNKD